MPRPEPARRAWLRDLAARAGEDPDGHAAVVAAVARLVATRLGTALPTAARLALVEPADPRDLPPAPPGLAVTPELVGAAREALLVADERRRRGAHYTPARLAQRLTALALGAQPASAVVSDPACGGGAFLLAAARHLAAAGAEPRVVVEEQLWGTDLDPLAVAATEAGLALWSGTCPPPGRLEVADGCAPGEPTFDAVIGNPPFLSQLARSTARQGVQAADVRAAFGDLAGPYTDTASLFLVAGLSRCRPGGRVVLVQPESLLAARDAGGVRRAVVERASVEGLWVAGEPVFDAAVRVCAPVLRAGVRQAASVRRWVGADVRRAPAVAVDPVAFAGWPTWSPLRTDASRPRLERRAATTAPAGTLGDIATATAGFREQFYGLAPFVVDDEHGRGPRMVTSGLIEPLRLAWGERPARIARRSYLHPRLDVDALRAQGPDALVRWVTERLAPKVVVATQSRVIEAAVDEDGTWVPSTPVIAVHTARRRLWLVAAALMAPPVTLWALERFGGAALAGDALKLSARQVLETPLPVHEDAWTEAAALLRAGAGEPPAERRALLERAGALLTRAHGIDGPAAEELLRWWSARLPS